MKRERVLSIAVATLLLLGLGSHTCIEALRGRDAWAVIGRPVTPMSYAGVARRTARRTTRRNLAYSGAYAGGAVTTLPAGCVLATGMYTCGDVHYRPYYDGPTVVYQVVQ